MEGGFTPWTPSQYVDKKWMFIMSRASDFEIHKVCATLRKTHGTKAVPWLPAGQSVAHEEQASWAALN
jgi:hypothetical protein